MDLKIVKSRGSDVYKDIARLPERFRKDFTDEPITEGAICWVTIGHRIALLSLRGQNEQDDPAIASSDVMQVRNEV
jgi:hypothetical protein